MSASTQIAGTARHQLRPPAEMASTEAMHERTSHGPNSAPVASAAGATLSGGGDIKWTPREDNILRQMRDDNRTNKEIGERLGRTAVAVGLRWALLKRKAEDAEIARAMATGESGRRRCLCGCGQMFLSRHRGERIAPECRELWQSAVRGVTNDISLGTGPRKRRPGAK